jgi:hypothetical protein
MDFAGISWGQHGGLILDVLPVDVPCLVTPYDLSILATLEPFPENGSKDLDKLPGLVNELTSMGISGYSLKFRPYIGLIYGRYLQFLVPEMAIESPSGKLS